MSIPNNDYEHTVEKVLTEFHSAIKDLSTVVHELTGKEIPDNSLQAVTTALMEAHRGITTLRKRRLGETG